MEDPFALARANVEPADITLHIAADRGNVPGGMGGADHHGIARDERGRVEPDVGGIGIELLIEIELQIDDAVGAEVGIGNTGRRIERDEAISGRDIENALLRPVRPIGYAVPR